MTTEPIVPTAPMKSIAVRFIRSKSYSLHFISLRKCIKLRLFSVNEQISQLVTAVNSAATTDSAFRIGGVATVSPTAPTTQTKPIVL